MSNTEKITPKLKITKIVNQGTESYAVVDILDPAITLQEQWPPNENWNSKQFRWRLDQVTMWSTTPGHGYGVFANIVKDGMVLIGYGSCLPDDRLERIETYDRDGKPMGLALHHAAAAIYLKGAGDCQKGFDLMTELFAHLTQAKIKLLQSWTSWYEDVFGPLEVEAGHR